MCVWNDLIFYLFIGRPGVTNGADGPAPLNGHERNGPDLAEAGHSSETSEAQASWEQSRYETLTFRRKLSLGTSILGTHSKYFYGLSQLVATSVTKLGYYRRSRWQIFLKSSSNIWRLLLQFQKCSFLNTKLLWPILGQILEKLGLLIISTSGHTGFVKLISNMANFARMVHA